MKKNIFYPAVFLLATLLSCNDKKITAADVPKPVVAAFNMKYHGAEDIRWITEKKNNKIIYEAQFNLDGETREAEFDTVGNFIQED